MIGTDALTHHLCSAISSPSPFITRTKLICYSTNHHADSHEDYIHMVEKTVTMCILNKHLKNDCPVCVDL